ncbi:FAD-binding oxidoreductase [Rhizobium sp. LjRoot98]|uniref:NAD(P)/FAD-dependent oxidoreductase n=1 Tax=unclassified Rhizobium TaxID=2613769 RepID=UPI0007163639|nr:MULTISPECIES: FAD-binding oxidoreductase [unclassified Rhizobium]KQV40398.1 D-amino acid oxidase [Rhizobium sp. Root1204]KQY02761.1 D-amino acid oxidase [Rhizobium sp. Root1334]KRB99367.1 D-amino acid oxidase [Rhizobium sp. Root73]
MPAPLMTIATGTDVPARADAVVIGGGIVGTSAAYYLARSGLNVVLLEKGRIGAEQSSRNWGWCRQQNRDARELPMATKSLELWDRLAAEIGEDAGFRRCGLTYLSDSGSEIEGWAKWRDFAITQGVRTFMLSPQEAAERGRATGKAWKGGVFSQDDGIADPARAAPVLALGVMKYGGAVLQECAARGVELSAGRVSGVVTEKGMIATSQVVVAGGAWASSFCHQLGIGMPQASTRSTILSISPGAAGDIPPALHTKDVSVTARGDGGWTLAVSGRAQLDPTPQNIRYAKAFLPMFARRWGNLSAGSLQGWGWGHESRRIWKLDRPTPMERARILDPRPNRAVAEDTLARARKLLPGLSANPVQATWAGYIDSTPDGVPVIGAVDHIPGFMIAAGFSGHGFGIGPGAGLLVAQMLTGQATLVDPAHYKLERFSKMSWGKVSEF